MASGLLFGINAALNLALMLALARILTPAAYGALATWSAAALFVATAAFDWIRFGAMRFYTPVSRRTDPATRATLDASFVGCVPGAVALLALFAGLGLLPEMTFASTAGLIGFALGNAANEYFSALARNLGDTRVYTRLVAVRHGSTLGIGLTIAALTQDPRATVVALGLAVWPSVVVGALGLRDTESRFRLWTRDRALGFARYGLPLIAAESSFQAIGLLNRLWLTMQADLAAAGIYSLTADLAFKVVAVMASVTEAALLPRLISREAEIAGTPGAEHEVRRGLVRLVGAMLVVAIGTPLVFWLLSPAIAAILLSPGFRAGFLATLGPALLGATLYVCQTYVLRPIFQIGLRTGPLLQSAILALAIDLVLLPLLAAHGPHDVMVAHAAGLAAGAALLAVRAITAMRATGPVAA